MIGMLQGRRRGPIGKRGFAIAAASLALAVLMSGCGSDGSDSDGPTNAGAEPSTAGQREARALVEKHSTPRTAADLSITQPVGATIPTGKKVAYITCGVPCYPYEPIFKPAVDALGWTLQFVEQDGSANAANAAWDQVLRSNPDAIMWSGTPREIIENKIQEAARRGIPVVGLSTGSETGNGVTQMLRAKGASKITGKYLAAWVVDDARESGTRPNAVVLNVPDFSSVIEISDGFKDSFGQMCDVEGCKQDRIDIGLSNLKTASDTLVSYLRSHPNVKYVIQSVDSFFSLSSALNAAGLKDIKVLGSNPSFTNLADIEAGRQFGTVPSPTYEFLYAMLDSLARQFTKQPLVDALDPEPLVWLVNKDNLPSTTELTPFVPDVLDYYKKLWGK